MMPHKLQLAAMPESLGQSVDDQLDANFSESEATPEDAKCNTMNYSETPSSFVLSNQRFEFLSPQAEGKEEARKMEQVIELDEEMTKQKEFVSRVNPKTFKYN